MYGLTRGTITLIGAAIAGFLIWVATTINDGTNGGYWAVYGIIAGAGLVMALSQLFGGWTKWGMPRMSVNVFLIGFLPVLVAAGWVLLATQPEANWFRDHIRSWSGNIGINDLVHDLGEYVAVLGFGIGLVFGFTFDTTGPTTHGPFGRRRRARAVPAGGAAPPPEDRANTREEHEAARRDEHTREPEGEPTHAAARDDEATREDAAERSRETEHETAVRSD